MSPGYIQKDDIYLSVFWLILFYILPTGLLYPLKIYIKQLGLHYKKSCL